MSAKICFSQISIEISNICNLKCVFCPSRKLERKRAILPFTVVKKIVDEISDSKFLTPDGYISPFVMGEPLMHPQFEQIVEYIKKRGIRLVINTNATLLDEAKVKFLYDSRVDKIVVNLSKSREDFLSLSAPISYEEYIDKIILLVAQHKKLHASTEVELVVMLEKNNFRKIPFGVATVDLILRSEDIDPQKFYRDILKLGLRWICFKKFQFPLIRRSLSAGIHFVFSGIHNWGNSLNLGPNEIKKAIIGSCNALQQGGQIAILADGGYSLCCLDYEGKTKLPFNVDNCSLADLFKKDNVANISRNFRKYRLTYDFCKKCRGGGTFLDWVFNQLFSCFYYNFPYYRNIRRLLTKC